MSTPMSTPFELSNVVRTCEQVWGSIRARHPDVPEVVIVVGSGEERGRLRKLGHWSAGRWALTGPAEGPAARGEVLLAAEGFKRGPADVLDTLLHEAAHAIATRRKVADTTRQGRYHNLRYKALAEEVGLRVEQMAPHGWAKTELTPETAAAYAAELLALQLALTAWRRQRGERADGTVATGASKGEQEGASSAPRSTSLPLWACACAKPRKMRMAASVMAIAPVVCGACLHAFAEASTAAAG